MEIEMIVVLKVTLVGIGATLLVDLWSFLLGLFKISSLDYRYVGRWIAYFPRGKYLHKNIMTTEPVRGESATGWAAHYLIGISFACLLVLVYGTVWLSQPTFFPAIVIGFITVCAPLLIMQPAFGFGIASAKLPNPNIRRLKSLSTHLVYGIGLYLTALLISRL